MSWLRKLWAFALCDFRNARSYKFAFCTQFLGIFASVLTFFFLARLVDRAAPTELEKYGGHYLPFVLLGIAFTEYMNVSFQSFASTIRSAQLLGTLEALLVTKTSAPMIVLGAAMYSFGWTSFRVFVYVFFGAAFFGLNLGQTDVISSIVMFILTIITFSSLGILSASFIMVLKKGNPVAWVFMGLSYVLAGVLYPISILPLWLQKISKLLPLTYALDGMRRAVLMGAGLAEISTNIIFLGAFSILCLPLALLAFWLATKKAKKDGSLTHY